MNIRKVAIGAAASGVLILGIAACGSTTSSAPANAPASNSQPATQAPAQKPAADPAAGKMTREKFEKINSGMSLAQVRAIVGSNGQLQTTSSTPNYPSGQLVTSMYQWNGDKFASNSSVMFQGPANTADALVVNSKTQFGLEAGS